MNLNVKNASEESVAVLLCSVLFLAKFQWTSEEVHAGEGCGAKER